MILESITRHNDKMNIPPMDDGCGYTLTDSLYNTVIRTLYDLVNIPSRECIRRVCRIYNVMGCSFV